MFFRAAWQACVAAQYLNADEGDFFANELTPLAQWFFSSGTYKMVSAGRLKAGWESIKRLRLESVAIESRKLGTDEWPPVVRKFESGAYRMVALCNEVDLKREGDAMHHCVGGGTATSVVLNPCRCFRFSTKRPASESQRCHCAR